MGRPGGERTEAEETNVTYTLEQKQKEVAQCTYYQLPCIS